jgi:hypothetical protein
MVVVAAIPGRDCTLLAVGHAKLAAPAAVEGGYLTASVAIDFLLREFESSPLLKRRRIPPFVSKQASFARGLTCAGTVFEQLDVPEPVVNSPKGIVRRGG